MILSNEQGNAAVTAIKNKQLMPGSLLLECIYLLDTPSHDALQSSRYLPPTSLRIVLDHSMANIADKLSHDQINRSQIMLKKEVSLKIVRSQAEEIREKLAAADDIARQQAPLIIDRARQDISKQLQSEIDRLNALRQHNPNVRQDEIRYFENQLDALTQVLEATKPRLEALRIIVAT